MQSHDDTCSGASASDCAERNAAPHPLSEPRRVTRGETHPEANTSRNIAFLDWIAVTVTPPPAQSLAWVRQSLAVTFCIPENAWKSSGRGWNGYKHRVDLGAYGLLAFGGEAQKGTFHFELNAHACKLIEDWNAVRVWGQTLKPTLLALT